MSKKLTVLHVEDSDDDALLITMALDMATPDWKDRVQMVRAPTVKQARKLVRERRPHLVLLDLNLQSESGSDFLAELKADPSYAAIPVLVLSTSDAPGDVQAAYQRQAASYIAKPPTFVKLVDTMSKLSVYWMEAVKLP